VTEGLSITDEAEYFKKQLIVQVQFPGEFLPERNILGINTGAAPA